MFNNNDNNIIIINPGDATAVYAVYK